MLNTIFKRNVQGRKHPGRCAFVELELLCYRKPKRVVQNKKNGHKNPNNSHNYHDEIEFYQIMRDDGAVFNAGIISIFSSYHSEIDGLVQDCSISGALAMEILQSHTKPSKYSWKFRPPCGRNFGLGGDKQNYLSTFHHCSQYRSTFIRATCCDNALFALPQW